MLSLLLADLPGLPMAKRGNAALAAIPVMAVSKVLRFKKGVVRGDGIGFLVMIGAIHLIFITWDTLPKPCAGARS